MSIKLTNDQIIERMCRAYCARFSSCELMCICPERRWERYKTEMEFTLGLIQDMQGKGLMP